MYNSKKSYNSEFGGKIITLIPPKDNSRKNLPRGYNNSYSSKNINSPKNNDSPKNIDSQVRNATKSKFNKNNYLGMMDIDEIENEIEFDYGEIEAKKWGAFTVGDLENEIFVRKNSITLP